MVLKTVISTHLILDLQDAVKQDVQEEEEALVTGDYWQVDPLRRELIRHHKDKRRNLHEMNRSDETPIPKDQLLDERERERDTSRVPEGQEEGSSQGQLARREEEVF